MLAYAGICKHILAHASSTVSPYVRSEKERERERVKEKKRSRKRQRERMMVEGLSQTDENAIRWEGRFSTLARNLCE